ncbi:MAG TPA: cupin domain-containing protein, partial [Polyangia bacterium]|nr:cupin domain-containing protein [Polyangia bacterium]
QRLGDDLLSGERPQCVVPPGVWQTAKSLGAWTLVGCTVAPAFDFADWHMPSRAELQQRFPTLTALVAALTRP